MPPFKSSLTHPPNPFAVSSFTSLRLLTLLPSSFPLTDGVVHQRTRNRMPSLPLSPLTFFASVHEQTLESKLEESCVTVDALHSSSPSFYLSEATSPFQHITQSPGPALQTLQHFKLYGVGSCCRGDVLCSPNEMQASLSRRDTDPLALPCSNSPPTPFVWICPFQQRN
jgi:hypothetical protein